MKVTYDPEVDVLRILFSNAPIEASDEDKPGVIIDYGKRQYRGNGDSGCFQTPGQSPSGGLCRDGVTDAQSVPMHNFWHKECIN
jgi:hypothetical protein